MTNNELKDIAILSIAFSILETDRQGIYLSKDISDQIDILRFNLANLLKSYKAYTKQIIRHIESLENKVAIKKDHFKTTATQLALNLIYLLLAPNERRGKPLASNIQTFYTNNKDNILTILNTACDTKLEDEAVDSEKLALIYIEWI